MIPGTAKTLTVIFKNALRREEEILILQTTPGAIWGNGSSSNGCIDSLPTISLHILGSDNQPGFGLNHPTNYLG